jgi:uncharacterized protein
MMRRHEALEVLREHREELRALGVKEIYLFGSVARDEAGPKSDVDVLVELSRPMGWEFFDIQEALELWFGRKVDLLRSCSYAGMYIKA